jgi:hypothetical protein
VLWLERLSSCTTKLVLLPELLLEEEELELLELDELLLEDDELLEDELLEELEDDELELLLDEDELLEEELLEDEELEVLPEPVQVGPVKLPSCVPWKPNTLEAVAPGAGSCQLQQLAN